MPPALTDDHPDPADWMNAMATLIGATQALTRPLFEVFGPITEQDAYEDLVLAFRAMLLGGLHFIDTPLLRYRENVGMSSRLIKRDHRQWLHRRLRLEPAVLRQRQLDCLTVGRHDLAAALAREAAGRTLTLRIELGLIGGRDALGAAAQCRWRYWLKGYRRRLRRWAGSLWSPQGIADSRLAGANSMSWPMRRIARYRRGATQDRSRYPQNRPSTLK